MLSLRKQATKIVRNGNNSHSFVYFIDGRIRTFYTHIDDINSQIAALFGSLNAISVLSFPAKVMLSVVLAIMPASAAFALDPGALPTGYTSISGNVQFNQTPGILNVSTGATKSIVNYDTFNIGSNARVNFNLPTSGSSILNRVVGGNTSEIYGTMSSNGRVFLVNPAGIFFGNGANVTVNGIVASTLGISDQKFLAGQYEFTRGAGTAPGHIEVAPGANITVLNGGSASFLASSFINNGNITANGGTIQVGIGDRITLGDDLIGITVNEALSDSLNRAALINTGTLTAAQVKLLASTVKHDMLDVIVNNSGRISANKVVDGPGGTVELIAENGIVNNSGVINASGTQGGQITLQGESAQNSGQLLASGSSGQGGTISVLGNQSVGLTDNAFINASGQTGGGSVFIGGDYMGGNPLIRNVLYTYVGQNVAIKADAINSGNGGKVIVWGNEATGFYGNISAQGGLLSGNGGFVETSGKNYLDMQGMVNANARNANGSAGSWLLDPNDVTITNTSTNTSSVFDASTNTWTFAHSGPNSTVSSINVNAINTSLNAGTNVTIHTGSLSTTGNNNGNNGNNGNNNGNIGNNGNNGNDNNNGNDDRTQTGSGTQPGDITVSALINKTSGTASTLTLLAANNITVASSGGITASGSAPLNVTLAADHDVSASSPSNGVGSIFLNGGISTNNGSVNISGVAANLNNNMTAGNGSINISASGGDISHTSGSISAASINLTTTAGNISQTGGSVQANSVILNATGGNITTTGGTMSGTSLSATTNNTGNSITINDADFNSATLKTNNGTVTYNDHDGVSVNVNAGTGSANITSNATGTVSNNGATESNLVLIGANQAQILNLTANAGNITQTVGGSVVGTTLNATANGVGSSIAITNADFSNVNLNTKFGDISYTDTDGVSAHFDTGSASGNTVNITAGSGTNLNGGAEASGLQITGANEAGLANLTANAGNVSQASGSINTVTTNLTAGNGGISQSGGSITGVTVNLNATNGNINHSNGTINANTANLTTNNGNIAQTGGSLSAGTVNLTATGGTISSTSGALSGTNLTATTNTNGNGITINDADFGSANLKANNGNVTYNDRDGMALTVNTGTGNATITTSAAGVVSNNGAIESDLILSGDNKAQTLNLTANAGNINQAVGTVSGNTLNATTNGVGNTITISNADFSSADLKTNLGNINYTDTDGIAVHFDVGTSAANTVNITAGNSSNLNNGLEASGIQLTGGSQAGLVNLIAQTGNIIQNSGALNSNTSNLTAQNGSIIQNGGLLSSVNLNLNAINGDINQSNGTMNAAVLNLQTQNGSILQSGGVMLANTIGLTAIQGNINQTGGSLSGGDVNLTTNGGSIAQTGGTMTGNSLTAHTDSSPGQSITISNADFTNITLKTNNANIVYSDSDGVNINVNAGVLGNVTVTTGTDSLTSNGVVENGLQLTGANKANTLSLFANHGDINQAIGSTISGLALNAETKDLGHSINLTDADFNSASLKSKDGNISYQDADSIITSVQAGIGSATVISKAAGLLSNNGSDSLGGIILTGTNSGVSVNLTANEGTITQMANSTVQGETLNAETKQLGKSIILTDTDFSFTNLKTNNGNITLNDRDGMSLNVQAGTGTANISSEVSSAHSVNFTEGPGLVLTGNNNAGTLNLTTNVGDITQTAGSTLSGNALNVKSDSGQVILTNDNANQFNQFSASSKQGNVSYRDTDGINITSVNLNTDGNSTLGNFSIQTNGAGNITQTGSINGVNNVTVTTDTGNATLMNALNDAQTLTVSSNQGNVSFRDVNNINVNSANLDADGNEVRGNFSLQTSLFGNITQTGNITGVDTLKLRTDLGNANLALNNNVHNLDTGSNFGSTTFTNTGSFNLTGANMNMNNLLWKGDLNLTTQTGQITQTAAINASELKITGNANLTNTQNNVDVLSAFGNGATVSYTDKNGFNLAQSNVGNGVLNLGSVTGEINQTAYSPILSLLLQNRNITNDGGVTAGTVNLNLGNGANAYLTNSQNAIGNFSLLGSLNCVKLINSNQLNLTGVNDSTGILDTTVLNGQNLTQSAGLTLGGLKVTMQDGGQFNLNDATNNVQALSVNATGENTQNIQGSFTNNGNLTLAASDMQNGDVSLTILNGGNLTQGSYNCASGSCGLAAGGLHSDELQVNMVDGGDATLSNTGNLVNSFSANAWGNNTINSQVQFTNGKVLNLASSFLNQGDLSLTLLNGANLNQDNLYNGGIFLPPFIWGNNLINLNSFGGNSISRNILSNGGVFANEFSVNLLGGGSASLNTQFNSVGVFSANTSGNSANSVIRFNNFGDLNLAHSDVGQGKLYIVTQGNLNNADLSENNRNITTNSSTLQGDVIDLEAAGGGNLDVYNNITAASQIRLTTSSPSGEIGFPNLQLVNLDLPGFPFPGFTIPTGGINIHAGSNVEARTGSVYINTDRLTIDGQVQGQLVQIWPWSLSLSMGIAGGSGNLQLSQGLVNHINNAPELGLNTLMFGHQNYMGTISLGSLNLSDHRMTDVAFNAPRVFDATPTNDSSFNVIMADNRNVYFTAGADTVANWATAPGGISYGSNSSLFADLDVAVSGSGLIHVRLADYTGVGNGFSILTGGGNSAFINTMDQDNSGSLKNYGSALSARAGSLIINEIKGTSINLPGNPVDNTPTSFGSVKPVQFIPNQSF